MLYLKLIYLLIFFLQVATDVKVTSQDYICTGDLHHVESEHAMENPHCDQFWSYQDNSIGTFLNATPECHSPCKELTGGKIILTECVNVTLAVLCSKVHLESRWTTEFRIHFNAKMIHQSLPNSVKRAHIGAYSSFGALMFISSLLYGGWLHHKNRNKLIEADVTNT